MFVFWRRCLTACGRRGRALLLCGLALGLIGGLIAPGWIAALRPMIAPAVVSLLALAVMRIGPAGVRAGLRGVSGAVGVIVVLQCLLPSAVALVAGLAGWSGPLITGLIVTLAAAPIIGAPSLALICGGDTVVALRLLVVGTLALLLTALPVFALMPGFGAPAAVLGTTGALALIVLIAGGVGLGARSLIDGTDDQMQALDGASALILMAVVIALMGAAGPALSTLNGWNMLAALMLFNLTLQIGAALWARHRGLDPLAPAIASGNRNIALFLGALPPALVADLFVFVGLYQIPMYLTPVILPVLLRRLYPRSGG